MLSPFWAREIRYADGDSDEEDICDENAEVKAPFFQRHHYFSVLRDKPDGGGKWREIHVPVIDTQYGVSGQILIDWIPVFRRNWEDGRSTQPSFAPPMGCELQASGQLTGSGKEFAELLCTLLAPASGSADLAEIQERRESERLGYLQDLGTKIKESANIPTMNKVDLEDPIDLRKCQKWLSQLARSFCEEFFSTEGSSPPSKRQVSDMMDGVFALIMQGIPLPSSEFGKSKPSKCAHCSESLFGTDELGDAVIPPRRRREGESWAKTWTPPGFCPICEHWVHAADTDEIHGY